MSPRLLPHIYLTLVALIYGANYTVAKDIMTGGFIGPLGFILFRVTAAGLLFALCRLIIYEPVNARDHGRLILCALTGVAINQMLFFYGLHLGSPIHASLLMTATPIIVLPVSALLVGERITGLKLLGIAAGCLGAVWLILQGSAGAHTGGSWLGDLMVFFNAVSFGVYLVLVRTLAVKYHPVTISFWVFLYGWVFCLPFGWNQAWSVDWSRFDAGVWWGFAYVLVFTTFLAYLLNALALRRVQPGTVSAYIYLQPLIAVSIAILWGKDNLDWVKIAAGSLIFSGVYLVSFSRNKPAFR